MKYLQAFICLLVVVFVLIPLYLALAAVCGVLRGQAGSKAEVGVNMDLNQLVKSWETIKFPKFENRILVVHPSRYAQIQERVFLALPTKILEINPDTIVDGIQIVQDPYVPLTQTVRVKRWLSKRDRKRSYVRKYRTEEQDVLGYWLYPDRMVPVRGL